MAIYLGHCQGTKSTHGKAHRYRSCFFRETAPKALLRNIIHPFKNPIVPQRYVYKARRGYRYIANTRVHLLFQPLQVVLVSLKKVPLIELHLRNAFGNFHWIVFKCFS